MLKYAIECYKQRGFIIKKGWHSLIFCKDMKVQSFQFLVVKYMQKPETLALKRYIN